MNKEKEVSLNLKWLGVLDEIKWYIEVTDWYYLIFWDGKYYFPNEKTLIKCLKKIREEINKDKIVYNL